MQKVWHRKFDGWWYLTLSEAGSRQQIKLVKGSNDKDTKVAAERQAVQELALRQHVEDAGSDKAPAWATAGHVIRAFLKHSREEHAADTSRWYNNAKAILLAVEATLTASPTLVNSTCLKQVVIGRDTDHSAGFPFCRIYLDNFASPVADTVSYERGYAVVVEIWQETANKGIRNAELDLANALHQVLDRLAGTWQLGIGVENTEIRSSPIQVMEANGGPMLKATIALEGHDAHPEPLLISVARRAVVHCAHAPLQERREDRDRRCGHRRRDAGAVFRHSRRAGLHHHGEGSSRPSGPAPDREVLH